MEEINIRVRGTHTKSVPAERGTVRVEIRLESEDLARTLAAVTEGQRKLVALIASLHNPRSGPVTWYSIDQISTYSWTPRDRDQHAHAPLHRVSVTAEVKFSDFAALSHWVREAVGISGFVVVWVDWALTAQRREAVEAKTRQRAVLEARDRAQNYADALGLGTVRVRSLSDAGLGFPRVGQGGESLMMVDTGPIGGERHVRDHDELVPRNIEVEAAVDAEFVLSL